MNMIEYKDIEIDEGDLHLVKDIAEYNHVELRNLSEVEIYERCD